MWRTTSSIPSAPISSNASSAPPLSPLARPSSAMASCGVFSPTNATARETSIGCSLSAAAVTTPSVPSAPISSCFKS